MKRKHIVFFTIVVLVSVAALVVFQSLGDRVPGGSPEQAIEAAPVAPVAGP